MILLNDELEWALKIKRAVENDEELANQQDYVYALLALVEMDDVQAALRRLQALQYVKEAYGIVHSLQEAKRTLREYVDLLFPNWFIHYMYNQTEGGVTIVVDCTGLKMSQVKRHPRGEEIVVKSFYYTNLLLSPDVEAVRHGVTTLVECSGFFHSEGLSLNLFRNIWELNSIFPQQVQTVNHYHTGVLFNVLMSMGKRCMPTDLRSKINVGCVSEERMDELFWTPNPEAGRARVYQRMEAALERRFKNEGKFSLERTESWL